MMYKRIAILSIGFILLFGCAKKKEEAGRLEQEMLQQQEQAAAESISRDTLQPVDTGQLEVQQVEPEAVPGESREPAGYVVQVAACPSLAYARYLLDLYKRRGYEPYLTTTVVDGEKYYRVRIGAGDQYQQAQALKAEIEDKYSVSAWIDRTG